MAEKLALKKALMNELKSTNRRIHDIEELKQKLIKNTDIHSHSEYLRADIELSHLQEHKDFIQRLIDICVDRNKF